jgi:DNA-binding transcriptional LysR family regulator
VVTDNGVVAGELIRQGFGIGVIPKEFAVLLTNVEPVLLNLVALPVPFWLTTHRELLTSRRIRVVYDLLAEAFS